MARKEPTPQPLPGDPRITRNEWILIALIVAVGFALRIALPSRMSVEQYDEGVYASNLAAGKTSGTFRYPFQHLYAPPLLPALIEYLMIFFGENSFSAMIVSLAAGSLTPFLLWYAARKWFGPPAGIAAATLAALSDFHILYSRAALTDALLCFWFLLAVHCAWEAYRSRSLFWGTVAGFATALAWWTKYTGWLPLAVAISGLIPWLIFHRAARPFAAKTITLWFAMAITAVTAWSPWWNALQQYGGYAAVAENHGRYLVGLRNWWPTLLHQVANHRFYSGWLSCLALLAAGLAALAAWRSTGSNFTWKRPANGGSSRERNVSNLVLFVCVLTAVGVATNPSVAMAFAAVAGMALQILPRWLRNETTPADDAAALAAWLVAAWFFGTFVSTPSYHPYPRLTLPWLVAAWLGTAAAIGAIVQRLPIPEPASDGATRWGGVEYWPTFVGITVLLAAVAYNGRSQLSRNMPGWEDRTDLARATVDTVNAAREFVRTELKRDSSEMLLYVYGEPGVFFHTSYQEGVLAVPVAELAFADPRAQRSPLPTFLVAGPPAAYSAAFQEKWRPYQDRFQKVEFFPFYPSNLVLAEENHPDALGHLKERPTEEIRLFYLK